MAPRKKARRTSAAPASDGSDGAAAQQQGSKVLPILQLPAGVLARHVMPHLGPWTRAQVRAACTELRSAADAALPATLSCVIRFAPHGSTTRQTRARAREQDKTGFQEGVDLQAACRLLRKGHYSGIEAVLLPHNWARLLHGSKLQKSVVDQLVSAIQQLGEASSHSLVRIAIFGHWSVQLEPRLFTAICAAWPSMQQLHTIFPQAAGDAPSWADALRQIPSRALISLEIDFYMHESSNTAVLGQLGAATQIAGKLETFSVLAGDLEMANLDAAVLLPLLAHPEGPAASQLQTLDIGACMGDVRALLSVSPNIVSLDLERLPEGVTLPGLVSLVPALRSLCLVNSEGISTGNNSDAWAEEVLDSLGRLSELGISIDVLSALAEHVPFEVLDMQGSSLPNLKVLELYPSTAGLEPGDRPAIFVGELAGVLDLVPRTCMLVLRDALLDLDNLSSPDDLEKVAQHGLPRPSRASHAEPLGAGVDEGVVGSSGGNGAVSSGGSGGLHMWMPGTTQLPLVRVHGTDQHDILHRVIALGEGFCDVIKGESAPDAMMVPMIGLMSSLRGIEFELELSDAIQTMLDSQKLYEFEAKAARDTLADYRQQELALVQAQRRGAGRGRGRGRGRGAQGVGSRGGDANLADVESDMHRILWHLTIAEENEEDAIAALDEFSTHCAMTKDALGRLELLLFRSPHAEDLKEVEQFIKQGIFAGLTTLFVELGAYGPEEMDHANALVSLLKVAEHEGMSLHVQIAASLPIHALGARRTMEHVRAHVSHPDTIVFLR